MSLLQGRAVCFRSCCLFHQVSEILLDDTFVDTLLICYNKDVAVPLWMAFVCLSCFPMVHAFEFELISADCAQPLHQRMGHPFVIPVEACMGSTNTVRHAVLLCSALRMAHLTAFFMHSGVYSGLA